MCAFEHGAAVYVTEFLNERIAKFRIELDGEWSVFVAHRSSLPRIETGIRYTYASHPLPMYATRHTRVTRVALLGQGRHCSRHCFTACKAPNVRAFDLRVRWCKQFWLKLQIFDYIRNIRVNEQIESTNLYLFKLYLNFVSCYSLYWILSKYRDNLKSVIKIYKNFCKRYRMHLGFIIGYFPKTFDS